MMLSKLIAICVLLQLHNMHTAAQANGSSGSCSSYSELESSLLATDENILNIEKVFYPPEENVPEFVNVTYTFEGSDDTSVWYWSSKTSHFLHPFEVLQFLSLLFSKPAHYYTGNVTITLKNECADLLNNLNTMNILQLLTQRVSVEFSSGYIPAGHSVFTAVHDSMIIYIYYNIYYYYYSTVSNITVVMLYCSDALI